MSKIICDICGTSYPETAKQCPICGSVQSGDVQRVTNEVKNDGKGSTGYTQVKAGHFTKSSVKKRSKDTGSKPAPKKDNASGGQDKDNRALVITAIVLLLAVIGVVIYIAIGFFKPYADQDASTAPSGKIACKDIRLSKVDYLLTEPDASELLPAKPEPENTTDKMTFTSKDPTIVSVDSVGNIKAVSEGTTYIDIRCGTIEKTITVKVEYANGNNSGSNDGGNGGENSGGNSDAAGELRFLTTEVELNNKGLTYSLYVGSAPKDQITWTSDNEAVATFKDGVVTAVGGGTTTVYAEYNGNKISCTVVCDFENNGGQAGNGGVTEDGGFAQYTGKITKVSEYVNVRSSPGVLANDTNLAGTLAVNTKVTVYEEQQFLNETWCRVSSDGEPQKWVRSDFILKD